MISASCEYKNRASFQLLLMGSPIGVNTAAGTLVEGLPGNKPLGKPLTAWRPCFTRYGTFRRIYAAGIGCTARLLGLDVADTILNYP